MRRLFGLLSVVLFVIGTASLALTLYLWIGDWPKEAKHVVDCVRPEWLENFSTKYWKAQGKLLFQRQPVHASGRQIQPLFGNDIDFHFREA